MTRGTGEPDRGGRPRDATVDARVRGATLELLRARGLGALRIDEVAAASGVPKSTIYRRWATLSALVVDAMAHAVGHVDPRLTGDPELDLRTLALDVGRLLAGPDGVALLQLGAQIWADPTVYADYRARLVDPSRALALRLVAEGQRSGAFRARVDPALLVDQTIGGLVYRRLVLHEDVTEADLAAIADDLIARLRP